MALYDSELSLDEMWADLESGIEQVYANEVSKYEYSLLYGLVYDFCTTPVPKDTLSNTQAHAELHKKLTGFFQRYLEHLLKNYEDLMNEQLLHCYLQQWQDYRFSSKVLDGVCSYLNRHWARRERRKGRIQVLEVYHLAIRSWREFLLEPLKRRMSAAIHLLIEDERRGETINTRLISTVLNSYIEMNINCKDPYSNKPNLCLYREAFEKEFLSVTEVFYYTESDRILREKSVSEFMKQIEIWFHGEQKRVQLCLHESTLGSLVKILENVIEKYAETFHSEFKNLLECKKMDDLKRMFQLLSRVPSGLEQLKVQFEDYIHHEGLRAVDKYNETHTVDPREYVSAILDIHHGYNAIVIAAFESDAGFTTALDKACKKFINKNAVTGSNGSSSKSAELLAKYCDLLLKKKSSDAEETETADNLNQAMIIFKYIEEKDVFQTFYSRMLAKRLIQQTNTSSNVETIMISKLKEACGLEYTSKLQAICYDACVSRDLNMEFHKTSAKLHVDFSINVFRTISWPFNRSHLSFHLPQELEQSVQVFYEFYSKCYLGRKLFWLHGMSRGELVSRCYDKPYTFQTSIFQLAVLLQFNTGDRFTVLQLEESTGIRSDILLHVLQALAKLRLLKLQDEAPFNASSTVSLNLGYQNKKLKVNLNVPVNSETKPEADTVHRQVEKGRKVLIEAAIIRIAKTRGRVSHRSLVSEVLVQLSQRFKPEIPVIKRCIQLLIEKEYLERVGRDAYSYIS